MGGEFWLEKKIHLHPAQIFRWLVLGLVAGFVISNFILIPWIFGAALLICGILLAFKLERAKLFSLFIIGILLSLVRFTGLPPAPADNFFIGKQNFVARISTAPRVGDKMVRYIVKPEVTGLGSVVLLTKPYPVFSYGEKLQVNCKKVELVTFSFYTKEGIFRQCSWPEISFLAPAPWSLRGELVKLRDKSGQVLKNLLAEPYASLASGMLWGDDSGLPVGLVQNFRRTGTSHLLAVSGFNVMVLTEILFWLLVGIGLWRRMASVFVLVLVLMFVIFTGAEPAVVRAGIMGSLLIISRLISRSPDKINLLFGTAAAMLLLAPILISNLGFQLSFAAMAGLLFVEPLLTPKLTIIPETFKIRQALAETLAANITTLPIILWQLDQVSLVSPVANLLISPVVMAVFIFGLPLVALNFLGINWLAPLIWALSLVLAYVVKVIDLLASLPWANAAGSLGAWLVVVICYIVLFYWLDSKKRLNFFHKNNKKL